jgi:hypothetical protein
MEVTLQRGVAKEFYVAQSHFETLEITRHCPDRLPCGDGRREPTIPRPAERIRVPASNRLLRPNTVRQRRARAGRQLGRGERFPHVVW